MASKKPAGLRDNLFQPIEFWSDTIKIVDNRIKLIAQTQRFGEIGLNFIVKYGKVVDVIFTERVRIRQPREKDDKKTEKNAG